MEQKPCEDDHQVLYHTVCESMNGAILIMRADRFVATSGKVEQIFGLTPEVAPQVGPIGWGA
jgi:hypothetical protein